MHIWVLNWSEPLPLDNRRPMRTAMLSQFASDLGHSVTWWTSSFDHGLKTQRCATATSIAITDRFRINEVCSPGYSRNVSLARCYDHFIGATRFLAAARQLPPPDIIFASLPTLELTAAGCRYAVERSIPVVVDILDLWPDVFWDVLPEPTKPAGRLLFAPYELLARYSCKAAAAITGPNEQFLKWGLAHARRGATEYDCVFPMAYTSGSPTNEAIASARRFWAQHGLALDGREFIVCFFGTLGRQFDLESVIKAAARIERLQPTVRFVICGTGESAERYMTLSRESQNVLWPGWVGAAEIWTLMRGARIGLAPYRPSPNFLEHLPNKPFEYLSAGLPILTTLPGALGRLLTENDCGLTYPYGDSTELLRLLLELHGNPLRLAELSLNAQATYNRAFVAEKVYPQMVNYLQSIVSQGARSPA